MVTYEIDGVTPDFPTLKKAVQWLKKCEYTFANITVWFDDEPSRWMIYRDGKIVWLTSPENVNWIARRSETA